MANGAADKIQAKILVLRRERTGISAQRQKLADREQTLTTEIAELDRQLDEALEREAGVVSAPTPARRASPRRTASKETKSRASRKLPTRGLTDSIRKLAADRSPRGITVKDVRTYINSEYTDGTIYSALARLAIAGELKREGQGRYRAAASGGTAS